MPAILPDHSAIALWLSPDGWSDKLKSIIKPFEGELEYYAVDRGVGKVQNDSADFIKVRPGSPFLLKRQASVLKLFVAARRTEERLARLVLRQTSCLVSLETLRLDLLAQEVVRLSSRSDEEVHFSAIVLVGERTEQDEREEGRGRGGVEPG